MLLGAALRRFSSRWIRAVGLVSATVLLCTAAGSFGVVAAAAPYPPSSPPCALSWSSNTARGSVLVGSGYDTNQPVQVTLYPQAQPLGSYAANASGAFEAPVDVPDNPRRAAVWVTATSPHRSCSVAPPSEGGTQPPASTPTDGTTAPSAGGSTTPGGAGSSNGPGGPGGPGASGNSGSGAGSGDGSGAGSGLGPTSPPYPPAGSSSSSTPGTPGTGASSAPASSAPNAPATTSPPPNADRATRALGLSLSVIVTIAVLLLLAGGLGVLVLTRRAS